MASVAARTRGILRRCAPQDDNYFVILRGTTWSEESRACAVQQHPPLRGGSVPPGGQSRVGVPYSGVAATPLHIATASGRQPFGGITPLRAQRVLKGKGLIRKKGKTAGVPLLVRSAAAQAAFPPAMRRQFRNALQGDPPAYGNGRPPHPAGAVPYNDLSVPPLARRSTSPQRGGRMGGAGHVPRANGLGGADSIGLSRARAGFFAAGCALRSE